MSKLVKIRKGRYRNQVVEDEVFTMVAPFRKTPKRSFVTVLGTDAFGEGLAGTAVRIQLASRDDMVMVNSDGDELPDTAMTMADDVDEVPAISSNIVQEYLSTETEEEAMDRLKYTFLMQNEMVSAVASGDVRALIIYGPPGVGKTHGVTETLNRYSRENSKLNINYVQGADASYLGMYIELYNNRDKNSITVFDDCDGILYDEDNLLLLKAALDSGNKRILSYLKDSKKLTRDDIPNQFEFEGSVIFLTNTDFESSRESRLKNHMDAIVSRCHYLDLSIHSLQDKILRIKQVVRDGMLAGYGFDPETEHEIVSYVENNDVYLREVSLRTVKKIADFVKSMPDNWVAMAEASCLKKEARYMRLAEQKKARNERYNAEVEGMLAELNNESSS